MPGPQQESGLLFVGISTRPARTRGGLTKVVITIDGQEESFPHYQWVTSGTMRQNENPLILTGNKTRLPGAESKRWSTARLLQGRQANNLVKWSHELPFEEGKLLDIAKSLPGFLMVPGLTYDSLDKEYLRAMLKNVNIMIRIQAFFVPFAQFLEHAGSLCGEGV
jgi:hypothetical protein